MEQLCVRLARAIIKGVKWGERNHVVFDNFKTEMIAFTKRRKADLKRTLEKSRITVRGHTIGFNFETTRWLKMYLDTGLHFQAHKNISLEKARSAEDRVRKLGSTCGLEPRLLQRVEVAAVQAVTLYETRIW